MIGWLVSTALAGSLEGEVAGDTLYAGPEADISGAELGLRVRGELLEADDRLVIGLDYRGREPLMGPAQTVPLRLLYRGDVAWETEQVEVAAGRFVAPAVVWLPMDGARATLRLGDAWVTAYGGRRGITASRRPLPLDAFLPAAGLQVGRATERYRAELIGTYSGDRIFLGVPGAEITEDIDGASGLARASVTPSDTVSFGAQGSAARNATYAVGPGAGELVVSIEAMSLYNALGWVALRQSRGGRFAVSHADK